jgi:hypothetical protein
VLEVNDLNLARIRKLAHQGFLDPFDALCRWPDAAATMYQNNTAIAEGISYCFDWRSVGGALTIKNMHRVLETVRSR